MSQDKILSTENSDIIQDSFEFVFEDPTQIYLKQNEMRKNDEFIDCILVIGEKPTEDSSNKVLPLQTHISAHRVILASLSVYFKTLFTTKLHPPNDNFFQLECEFLEQSILEDIVEFAYTGFIKINNENIIQICIASHYLQIDKLVEITESLLCKHTNFQHSFEFFFFAQSRNLKCLLLHSIKNIILNFENIFLNEKFENLTFEEITLIFNEMNKYYVSQKTRQKMYQFIIDWVNFDLKERILKLELLLGLIPLHNLSLSFLCEKAAKEKMITDSQKTVHLLLEAFNARTPTINNNQNYFFILNSSMGSFLKMSCETKLFEDCSLASTRRMYYSSVAYKNDIYTFGGYYNSSTSTTAQKYIISENRWVTLKPMPNARMHCSAAVLDEFIYVVDEGCIVMSKYSIKDDSWSSVKVMNGRRENFWLLEVNKELYALGDGDRTVEKYNPNKNEWTFVADMSEGFTRFGATVYKNRIYVTGNGKTEVYDPKFDIWQRLPDPGSRTGSVFVTIDDKLYSIGGNKFGQGIPAEAIFVFDPVVEEWSYFCNLKQDIGVDHAVFAIEIIEKNDEKEKK